MDKTRICFVCSGCTDRSPMAVWIANAKIKENKLPFVVFARGLFVGRGDRVCEKSVSAVEHLGIPANVRVVPTEMNKDEIGSFDYVLCMTNEQKAIIKSKFNYDAKTISEFADFIDIEDPFGGPQEMYDKVAKDLDYAIEQIFERIYKEKLL